MRYFVKGKFLKTLNVWFEGNKVDGSVDADVIHYYGVRDVRKDSDCVKEQKTLITSLKDTEDDIFSGFANNTRNEIRRAEREKVHFEYYGTDELNKHQEILSGFIDMYKEMYSEKGIVVRIDESEMAPIVSQGGLLITRAVYGDQILVYHAYVLDKNNARLLYSCSNFRINDKETQKIIGRANRFLHWKDMVFLKNRGIGSYDWGGVSSFEKPNGIDKFKISFNGEKVIYYNLTDIISLKAKILKKIKR